MPVHARSAAYLPPSPWSPPHVVYGELTSPLWEDVHAFGARHNLSLGQEAGFAPQAN